MKKQFHITRNKKLSRKYKYVFVLLAELVKIEEKIVVLQEH